MLDVTCDQKGIQYNSLSKYWSGDKAQPCHDINLNRESSAAAWQPFSKANSKNS